MVEKRFPEISLHRVCKVVAVTRLLHVQVHLGQFQNLVPILPGCLDVQADHPFIIQLGHVPPTPVILVVRRTQRPDAGGEENHGRYGTEPDLPELKGQEDQGEVAQDHHRVTGLIEVAHLPHERPGEEQGADGERRPLAHEMPADPVGHVADADEKERHDQRPGDGQMEELLQEIGHEAHQPSRAPVRLGNIIPVVHEQV